MHSRSNCEVTIRVHCGSLYHYLDHAGVPPPAPDHSNLERAIGARCAEFKLQATEYFVCKTIQLYEMIVVRHGLMLVGQPFSGKTSSLKVIANVLGVAVITFHPIHCEVHWLMP